MGMQKVKYNWIGLLAMLVGIFACFLFVLPAALSGNLLFASNVITQQPAQVTIYYDGDSYTYEPGDPQYDALVSAANETLANETGFWEGFGWSEERFTQARAEGIAVEFLYAQPVKIPGRRVDIADPTRLFFPLEVFGHTGEMVFRGGHLEYWGLPIRVDTLDRMRAAVEQIVHG